MKVLCLKGGIISISVIGSIIADRQCQSTGRVRERGGEGMPERVCERKAGKDREREREREGGREKGPKRERESERGRKMKEDRGHAEVLMRLPDPRLRSGPSTRLLRL